MSLRYPHGDRSRSRAPLSASFSPFSPHPPPTRRTPAPTPPPRWTGALTPVGPGSTSTPTARPTSAASVGGVRGGSPARVATGSRVRRHRTPPSSSTAATRDGRMWGDVNGDGRADYCRRVGDAGSDLRIGCSISTADRRSPTAGNTLQAWGANETLAGRQRATAPADYCRITGADPNYAAVLLGQRRGLGVLGRGRPGAAYGRAWVDFTGDGKADFCRVTSVLLCTLVDRQRVQRHDQLAGRPTSATSPAARGPTSTATEGRLLPPRRQRRRRRPHRLHALDRQRLRPSFVVRRRSSGARRPARRGSTSRATATVTSAAPSRPRPTNTQLFCTLWTPSGLANTIVSGPLDVGYPPARAWVDHNGDGKADYCRASAPRRATRASPARSPTAPRSGRCRPRRRPRRTAAGPAPPKKTRIVVTLAYDYNDQGPLHPPQPPACQPRPARRDGQGDLQEGLLAQERTRKTQRPRRQALAQDAGPQAPEGGHEDQVVVSQSGQARRRPRRSASAPGSARMVR